MSVTKKPSKPKTKKKAKPRLTAAAIGLNPAQSAAVMHGEGPLLIIAGAGTGKTSVITNRIAHLILDKGVNTDGVLALTFTDKAAGEMTERVDKLMPMGYVDLWISTFHAFCEKILRLHALDIGLPNEFTLLNQTSQWLLVRKNLERFQLEYYKPLGNPTKFIHELLKHFSRCKDQEITPQSYREYAQTLGKSGAATEPDEIQKIQELARAFETYQQLLLENNALDFGDLITYTLTLFTKRPAILRRYQQQFSYILVDEFQDTNHAQYSLVKLLAGERHNITVVGDDDQSIYKFRGASISNIMHFMQDYPAAKQVVLTENYRSLQGILDLAYRFIKQNDPNRLEARLEGIQKTLHAASKGAATCEHMQFAASDDEILGVIKKIADLKKKDPDASWGDFAILTRSNDAAQQFTNVLRKTDLPHQYVSVRGLYGKPVILDVINYLKLLDNYHESTALYRILRSPISDLSDTDIASLTLYATKKSISLFEAMRRAGEVEGVSSAAISQANELLALISKHTAFAKEKTVGEVVVAFLNDSGYLERLLKLDEETVKKNTEYLDQFYRRLRDFEESTVDPSIRSCLEELELEIESGDTGALAPDVELGPDAIKVMTIHASKGLEFSYVFLPQLVEQRFPTIARGEAIEIPQALVNEVIPEGDIHLQEERRLMYVAITRAKKAIYFTSAEDYGGARKKKLSRFLMELAETSSFFTLSESIRPADRTTVRPADRTTVRPTVHIPAPKHVSFSQIAAFTKCPYQYKLAFIYKIPLLGKGQFSYGKSMHAALQHFFELAHERTGKGQSDLFSAKKPMDDGLSTIGALVTLPELLDLYEKHWQDDWYETHQRRDEYKKKGTASLTQFYASVKDKQLTVRQLEKPFTIKLAADGEVATIRGIIDRIDVHADGTAEIIDYKTGTPKTKLDKDDKRQLLLYQLACMELPALTDGAPVQKLTFHYLDDNTQVSFIGSEKELDEIRASFSQVLADIRDSKFEATPDPYTCKFCDFKNICEFKVL